jgi:tetratricopeptide (TPR) repeat protein
VISEKLGAASYRLQWHDTIMSSTQQFSSNILLQRGIRLDQTGRHDAAARLYRQILEQQPDHAYALHLLGADALRRGELDAAAELIGSAIRVNSREPTFHLFLGQVLQRRGDLNDALVAYDHAITLAPQAPSATFRRATVLMALKQVPEAVAGFRQALAIAPKLAAAALNQAQVYRDTGELESARRLLRVILEFYPRVHEAYVMLGHVLLILERYNEARKVYAELFYMERGGGWNAGPFTAGSARIALNASPVRASAFFFKNLIGHIEYLIAHGKLDASFTELAGIYRDILEESAGTADSHDLITLTPAQIDRVQTVLPRALHYADSAPVRGSAVNPALDSAAIQRDYRNSPWRMTWFDDFLTPGALNSLRKFCLESTIFFRQSHNTFVSSYLHEGFNCSVLYKIVSELKVKFPDVVGPLSLQNIWCYRQAPEGDGVLAHSDQAAVTFNFWITPDDANLEKNEGGLVLYDKEQPREWDWYETNAEKENPRVLQRIMAYLEDANMTSIPYRENRAVMFYSNMFHRSDRFRFKPGYDNSRMNVTMLFGQHASQIRKR